jgi:hypothetical protein
VRFERVLMCDNTSAISVAKNPVFHKKMSHVERRHHFLRDDVEKGDIEMRYIDTERQLADIFTIGLCHPYGLRGSWCFFLYIVYFSFLLYFPHTHLSHFVSPVILAYICSIMLITVLG